MIPSARTATSRTATSEGGTGHDPHELSPLSPLSRRAPVRLTRPPSRRRRRTSACTSVRPASGCRGVLSAHLAATALLVGSAYETFLHRNLGIMAEPRFPLFNLIGLTSDAVATSAFSSSSRDQSTNGRIAASQRSRASRKTGSLR